jgi:hypothetical protein
MYTGMYAYDDVAIARELVKLAGLLISAGDVRSGGEVVGRAIGDLQSVVSDGDSDLQEARAMMRFLSGHT